jgi:hypothetical protein
MINLCDSMARGRPPPEGYDADAQGLVRILIVLGASLSTHARNVLPQSAAKLYKGTTRPLRLQRNL